VPGEQPIRVLVVDDDYIVADSLALIVRGRGFESRAVYSGEDAAEVALTWKPDAVIADVIMGKLDGVALAAYLAQVLPSCKVLLISGNLDAAEMMNESNQPGHTFPLLAKPVHPDHIFEFLGSSSYEASNRPCNAVTLARLTT
jgi:DNA-binding NtrC family response regulator